jgi:two-component system, sensor histidine kinase and response regulator
MFCQPLQHMAAKAKMVMDATILFVEDNEDLRENAALVLGLEGYKVQVASDGREALEFLENGLVPSLIVSDIMMPRMDGYEFFEAVRQKAHLKAVPFIFLTARGSRQDISTGRMLGADDYLVKPFDPEEFLIAVQNKLQRIADVRDQVAQSLNDARQILVQLLSHELRTPLTYVTGGFALLAEELESIEGPSTSEDVRTSLDLIQNGTQRLNRLAQQMVLYSEIMSGFVTQQIALSGETLDIGHIAWDAITNVEHLAAEKGITLAHSIPDAPLRIHGLMDRLVIAFTEVVRNAVQHTPENSTVDVLVSQEDDRGVFTVIDQGEGIRPEDQDTIWDVMIQSNRRHTEQQGIGMGLPIVKGLINAHAGDVFLYSTPHADTEVVIRLPLAGEPDA